MKKNYLLTISVLSLLFIFASCEKNDNDVNNPKPKNPEELYAKTEYNLDMRDFAMAIDIAINSNSSFKELVHEKTAFAGSNTRHVNYALDIFGFHRFQRRLLLLRAIK